MYVYCTMRYFSLGLSRCILELGRSQKHACLCLLLTIIVLTIDQRSFAELVALGAFLFLSRYLEAQQTIRGSV